MTPNEMNLHARSRLLLHQLRHATFFECLYECRDCDFQTPWKGSFGKHISSRKGCTSFIENRIEELYQSSVIVEQGTSETRGQFKNLLKYFDYLFGFHPGKTLFFQAFFQNNQKYYFLSQR